ncbi:MAG: hypothetical protein R2867_09595 [Caldilineaceae bacterium]
MRRQGSYRQQAPNHQPNINGANIIARLHGQYARTVGPQGRLWRCLLYHDHSIQPSGTGAPAL